VLEAMGRLMEGRTVITITHRLQALDGCTQIVRVADGHVYAETVAAPIGSVDASRTLGVS
jgi:ABC-type transport system involved in cytochrome bd biosynthesis fused ATPase/permease subunit